MLFDTTLRRELARTFGATLVVILTIVLTLMLMNTLGRAAGGAVAPQDVVLLMGYTALGHGATMLALTLFITVVATLGRMYRDSEMAVWFSSGAGLSQFVKPVLRMAWPVLLVVALLVFFVWPWGNQQSLALRDRYQQRSDFSRVTPGVFQTSRDGSRVFFVERDIDQSSGQTNARNVFIQTQRDTREAVIAARSGRLEVRDGDRWFVLERGQLNEVDAATGDKSIAMFDRYEILAGDQSVQRAQQVAPRVMSTFDLVQQTSPPSRGELTWRMGLALGAGNLLLLGVGLSARNPRKPSNWNMLFALLAFFVYYNLINLSQAWVAAGRYDFGLVLLALHGSVFLLAVGLIGWRDHAAVMRWWPRAKSTRRPASAT